MKKHTKNLRILSATRCKLKQNLLIHMIRIIMISLVFFCIGGIAVFLLMISTWVGPMPIVVCSYTDPGPLNYNLEKYQHANRYLSDNEKETVFVCPINQHSYKIIIYDSKSARRVNSQRVSELSTQVNNLLSEQSESAK